MPRRKSIRESLTLDKPTLSVDFYGVIQPRTSDDRSCFLADDPPIAGAFDWLARATDLFRVAVLCDRFGHPGVLGPMLMKGAVDWFAHHGFPAHLRIGTDPRGRDPIYLAATPPPCHIMLGDRAVTFAGTFPDPAHLLDFRPWNP